MRRMNASVPCRFFVFAIPVVILASARLSSPAATPSDDYAGVIRPLLEKKCFECHGPEKQKGELNLADFKDYTEVTNALERWAVVLERVQAFEMPPKKAGQLDFNQHRKLMEWLRVLPKPPATDCDQLASDRTANFYRGYVMSRRLNKAEYLNTLRDLFGVPLPVEELLPADGGGGEGFDTTGNALFLSTIHVEKYLATADQALALVLADKPRKQPDDLAVARGRILFVQAPSGRRHLPEARAAAREVVTRFATRAFRRPVAPEEIERLLELFDRGFRRGDGFVPSVRLALKAVLVSPHFLFLAEPEPGQHGVQPLAAVPLASKLSYFIWASMPDERLMQLAIRGELLETNTYRSEIRRLLADPKAAALGERFALQWLDLERLGADIKPDPAKFPEFDRALLEAMRGEVVAVFNHILRQDRPLSELIDADYTFVNARLAKLYGMEGVRGDEFRAVKVPGPERGGILGMAAVHASTSYPLRTSPVLRGRWILESLLGDKIPPPPPDTPTLDESTVQASQLTFRQQLETHRTKPECASCHDKMDPLGFGLENFDVLGRWRASDRGYPVDAQGTLPSGRSFAGPAGLKAVLLERKEAILRHLARKLTGFAFGRELNKFDDCVIDRAMEELKRRDYRASVLIEVIATSFPFQHRFYPKEDS
jgi:hypothetical protein